MRKGLAVDDGERSLAGQFALRWTAPPGWATPPDDFVPDLEWRPDGYWPPPPEDWDFWQIKASPDVVALFHQPMSEPPSDPGFVWVPPPSWPTPPERWIPPPGWTPDRTWGPAPAGWQFWRQPEVDHRAEAAVLLSTRTGRLRQANRLERLFRTFAEHLVSAESDELQQELAFSAPSYRELRRNRQAIRRSNEAAAEALTNARRGLLWALSRDLPVDEATLDWQPVALQAVETAIDWVRHARGLHREESPEAQRLRLLNEPASGRNEVQFHTGGVPWQEAEHLAAAALRQFGFRDARTTEGSADGGIDVYSSRIVAQVKYTSKPVGRPVLQQLVGAANGRATACFALSGYSGHAQEYAEQQRIALFTIALPSKIRPQNDAARRLAAHRSR